MAAGVLNGSMGIVGPPVVLFYFSSPVGMTIGRASIITYLIGTDTAGTVMFAAQDLIDPSIYWRTALFLPLLFLGSSIGSKGFIKTDPGQVQETLTLCPAGPVDNPDGPCPARGLERPIP